MGLFGFLNKGNSGRGTSNVSYTSPVKRPTAKALGTSESLNRAYAVDGTV